MKLSDTCGINPMKDMVLVSIITRDYGKNELVLEEDSAEKSTDQVKMYFGEVLSMGPDATSQKHCPGLKVGDTILFSQFAGHYVSTQEDRLVKIIRGYDIMTTLENINDITKSNVHPTANRLLVAARYRDETDDGLILNDEESRDPSLADLDFGIVLKKGLACTLPIEVGQVVAYPPYVGECVKKQPEENIAEYRVIVEQDILFTA